jgi:hypothetical protein
MAIARNALPVRRYVDLIGMMEQLPFAVEQDSAIQSLTRLDVVMCFWGSKETHWEADHVGKTVAK